jgi:hypothetical protein
MNQDNNMDNNSGSNESVPRMDRHQKPNLDRKHSDSQSDKSQSDQRSPGKSKPDSEKQNFSENRNNKEGMTDDHQGIDPKELSRKENRSFDHDTKSGSV